MTQQIATFEVDIKGWARQNEWLLKKYGLAVGDVVHDQHRLWTQSILALTPPKSGQFKSGSDLQKARSRIEKDAAKLFVPIRDSAVLTFYKDLTDKLALSGVIVNETGDMNRMRGLHRARRNKRTGRIRGGPMRVLKEVGGNNILAGMYVPEGRFNRFVKRQQKKLGLLKAGWLVALEKFERIVKIKKTPGRAAPAYVKRHTRRSGFARPNMKPNGDGFDDSVNTVPWARGLESILVATGAIRERDLAMFLDKRIEKLAKQFAGVK